MNEAQATQEFQIGLRSCGFKVFKHCDRITKGIPDTSSSRNGVTTWYEFKAIRYVMPIQSLDWNRILTDKDMVQLANMVELETKARAIYVLFQIFPRHHTIHLISPSAVLESYKGKKAITLPTAWSMNELEALWLK